METTLNRPALWTLPALNAADHKYTRGHAVLLGGGEFTGAARLAAIAAQRAGAGLVTVMAPEIAWPIYATSLLSALTRPYTDAAWNESMNDDRVTAVLVGPGAGVNATASHCIATAQATEKPLVLDADALTLLAQEPTLRTTLTHAVLTPHEGEYAKLARAYDLDVSAEKSARALALAKASDAVVVLKGADTYIASPEGKVVHHHSATPWLATAGTGDVLAGLITGLLAQGMPSFEACCAGAWLHTQAAQAFGHGMVAEDLLAAIPAAFADSHP
ncbi:MAG TPA: NAD(P)H-hydrate dehydratase [Verrucomicrobiales bacterium]|nr:NAD(P)H-hydrate dehydratase [Verrucomicrobiales bacterium]